MAVDTSVFIANLSTVTDFLQRLALFVETRLLVPWRVWQELDGLKERCAGACRGRWRCSRCRPQAVSVSETKPKYALFCISSLCSTRDVADHDSGIAGLARAANRTVMAWLTEPDSPVKVKGESVHEVGMGWGGCVFVVGTRPE